MKEPTSVSLDTEVIEKIKAAANLRRESASKWLEDAAIQRLQRISNAEERPDAPPPPTPPAENGTSKPTRYTKRRQRGK